MYIPQLHEPDREQMRRWLAEGGYEEDVVFNAHPVSADVQILLTFTVKR